MEYTKLGTTGLDVSPIAIGAMTYGEPDRGHPVWSKGEDEAPLTEATIEPLAEFHSPISHALLPLADLRSSVTNR